jgi:hypothetical protein
MDGATQNCPTYPFMFGIDVVNMDINLMSSKYKGLQVMVTLPFTGGLGDERAHATTMWYIPKFLTYLELHQPRHKT